MFICLEVQAKITTFFITGLSAPLWLRCEALHPVGLTAFIAGCMLSYVYLFIFKD